MLFATNFMRPVICFRWVSPEQWTLAFCFGHRWKIKGRRRNPRGIEVRNASIAEKISKESNDLVESRYEIFAILDCPLESLEVTTLEIYVFIRRERRCITLLIESLKGVCGEIYSRDNCNV